MKIDGSLPKDQRILAAAEIIFSMYGYEKATLDQIIALADVGKGTVYKYFGNKEQLFYKLVIDRNNNFVNNLLLAVASAENLEQKLLAYFKEMVTFYYENSTLWQIICFEMLGASNTCRVVKKDGSYKVVPRYGQIEISEDLKERILRYHALLKEEYVILENIVADAIKNGVMKHNSDTEISSKYLFFGVAMSIFNPTQSLKDKMPANEAAEIIVDRFLYGESALPRPKEMF